MAEPVLVLDRLTKSFGALAVTCDVSLDLKPGEVHALIGPNGAGKTTLVSQIAGSLTPDSGHIRFCGTDVTRLDMARRARMGLGRVFQISSVVGDFTALENVVVAAIAPARAAFAAWRPALADRETVDRAEAVLVRVGLGQRLTTRAIHLSHGEQRALELAMSLVQDPKALLLDEPMAGTGRTEGQRLTELLLELKGGAPMLLVEHDMKTVFTLADRITVLIAGAVAVTGAPEVIRADPLVRRAYLGEERAV